MLFGGDCSWSINYSVKMHVAVCRSVGQKGPYLDSHDHPSLANSHDIFILVLIIEIKTLDIQLKNIYS